MKLCTVVYNSKNAAQCGKWCTNAPEEVQTRTQTPTDAQTGPILYPQPLICVGIKDPECPAIC